MVKFKTQYDDHPRVHVDPGDPVKVLYGPIFDKNGVMSLQEIGKHDLYGEIQSHADSVDINVLLARYANGDVGALARVQGAYGDFTQMPSTFAEALNTMIAAEQYFMGLPVETRAQFGHDFHQFIASMDTPEWSSKLGIAQPGVDSLLSTPSAPAPAAPASEPAPAPAATSPS